MEHARVNLILVDPVRFDDVIQYVVREARPRLEDEPGSHGVAVLANPELGVAVVESFWVSGDAMRESERGVAPLRKEAVRRGGGTVSVEHFEVANYLRVARPPSSGAGVRLTRADADPERVKEAIVNYEDVALPWLTETDGFCSAVLFVHRRSGRSITETLWRDEDALAGSRSAAAAIRADAVAATDCEIRALEEYRLDFSSVHPG